MKSLYTALITPFKDGSLDIEGFEQNLQNQIMGGVEGLLLLGTTAETPTLSSYEKKTLLEIAVAKTSAHASLMVGTGTNNTATTLENTRFAESLKASCALIITPFYNRPTQRGIFEHFKKIAENSSIPIILYNHPGRTGQNIRIDTLKELLKFPNIVGIKDASADISYIQEILYHLPLIRPDFKIYSGDDFNALTYMTLGAHGLISIASNLIPQRMIEWVAHMKNKQFDEALSFLKWHYDLFKALNIETNPVPIKTAMALCQRPSGPPRLPLFKMSRENQQFLHETLIKMDILHGQAQPKHCSATI